MNNDYKKLTPLTTDDLVEIPAQLDKKYKVSQDVAELEFDRWAEEMDLEFEPDLMDEEDEKSFLKLKRRLVRSIQRGNLVIDDNGNAIYTLKNSDQNESIKWNQLTGQAITATDGRKTNQPAAKTHAAMALMTKTSMGTFNKMKGIDKKVCDAIFILLMD